MKKLIITTIAFASMLIFGAAAQELNKIPIDKVTATNAYEVFDAAVATTNYGRIASMVSHGKVTLDYAVHKTMDKKPFSMCLSAFKAAPSVTNYAL